MVQDGWWKTSWIFFLTPRKTFLHGTNPLLQNTLHLSSTYSHMTATFWKHPASQFNYVGMYLEVYLIKICCRNYRIYKTHKCWMETILSALYIQVKQGGARNDWGWHSNFPRINESNLVSPCMQAVTRASAKHISQNKVNTVWLR